MQIFLRSVFVFLLSFFFLVPAHAAGPVWRVTDAKGHSVYLAGSMHQLRSVDYPLPIEFNRAFDASSRLAFEVDPQALIRSSESVGRAGKYPHGDNLKKHVDPRTYEYLRRYFAVLRIPEEKFSTYRPWLLSFFLDMPGLGGFSDDLGVEEFLTKRARTRGKPTDGLESAREHADVFIGLSDKEAEITLLISFLPQANPQQSGREMIAAWRRGDAEFLARDLHDSYRDYPKLAERLLDDRNRRWIPKIENYLARGQTCMVIVGAAHMGGSNGLLALLRARSYHIEQL